MSKKKREGRVVSLPVSTAQAVAGKSVDNGQLTIRLYFGEEPLLLL